MIHLRICASLSTALVLGLPALAAAQDSENKPENMRDNAPNAVEVIATPIRDLNIDSKDIPEVLLVSLEKPYDDTGLANCSIIATRIAELDAALGDDIDIESDETDRLSTGRIARSIVGGFIPFRGILREVTGAAESQRDLQAAIFAGAVRRGYLKGLGQQRGCAYPARPAFARVEVKSRKQKDKEAEPPSQNPQTGPVMVSEPVVQTVP